MGKTPVKRGIVFPDTHAKLTGEIFWELELPAHQTGVPMTYMHQGFQYIVVAVGNRDYPAELVALRLPQAPR